MNEVGVPQLGDENLSLSVGQPHQYFRLSGDFFGCPRRTDNQNFERWFSTLTRMCTSAVSRELFKKNENERYILRKVWSLAG